MTTIGHDTYVERLEQEIIEAHDRQAALLNMAGKTAHKILNASERWRERCEAMRKSRDAWRVRCFVIAGCGLSIFAAQMIYRLLSSWP